MEYAASKLRRRTGVAPNLLAGLVVHGIAGLILIALSALHIEGCDTSDGLAASLFIAAAADLVITTGALLIMIRANRHHYRAALLGWALSFIPALAGFTITMGYVNSLPSGCSP